MPKHFTLVALLLLCPAAAQAYVDPGLVAVLYQFLYVAVFGTLASLIFKPWRYLKSLLSGNSRDEVPNEVPGEVPGEVPTEPPGERDENEST